MARAGLDRYGRWAAPALMLAANLPDAESLLTIGATKPVYLLSHRGLSHTFLGALIGSAIFAGIVCIVDRKVSRAAGDNGKPASWPVAFGVILAGVLSHLLLDWFNTYGVQPLIPFNEQHFYGDFAFIIDPWMWLILGTTCFLCSPLNRLSQFIWPCGTMLTTGLVAWAVQQRIVTSTVLLLWVAGVILALALRKFHPKATRNSALAGLTLWAVYCIVLFGMSRVCDIRALRQFRQSHPQEEIGAHSANPTPGIPWRFEVIVQSNKRLYHYSCNLMSGVMLAETVDSNLDDPALEQIRETLEYRAWSSFARHPVAKRRGPFMVLGDMRYQVGNRGDWTELVVPFPHP